MTDDKQNLNQNLNQGSTIMPPKPAPASEQAKSSQERKEANKAKKAAKKARSQAQETARLAKNAAKKEERRRRDFAFKQTVVGKYVVDENGNPIRRYTLAEKILDNKILGYGIAFGIIVLSMVGLIMLRGGFF